MTDKRAEKWVGNILERCEHTVRDSKNHQDNYANGGCPNGDRLQNPHQGTKDKDGYNPVLDCRKVGHTEAIGWQKPQDEEGQNGHKQFNQFILVHIPFAYWMTIAVTDCHLDLFYSKLTIFTHKARAAMLILQGENHFNTSIAG